MGGIPGGGPFVSHSCITDVTLRCERPEISGKAEKKTYLICYYKNIKIPVHAETQLNTEGGGGVHLDTPLL